MAKAPATKTPPSQICIDGQYLRTITQVAKGWFPTEFRIVSIKGEGTTKRHFQILLVDADGDKVKKFIQEYPMCKIENTISQKNANIS